MSDVVQRLDGLTAVVEAGRGRVPGTALAPAESVVSRAGERLKLSGDHTIVALAGATGSGKSSLFNSLSELELAGVGVRRPTTSWALACAWGPDGAADVLEWMGIPPRHQVSRAGLLERAGGPAQLEGLILLDLPDHDSTEVSHHLEMDRLVSHSDLLVWVLDPQKYADAALHERYIRPMAGFAEVTLVVLNQIDRIPYDQRAAALADVKRLLADDGLPDVKVLGVSAQRGDGMDELRAELAERIRAKNAAKARLVADIKQSGQEVADAAGSAQVPVLTPELRAKFEDDLAQAAGVPQVVEAARESSVRRARRFTAWPVLRWFSRSRRSKPTAPELGAVQRASAELAVRDLVDRLTQGLKLPWRVAARHAVQQQGGSFATALDDALHGTDLRLGRTPAWWRVVLGVQWLLLLGFVASLLWLGQQGLDAWFDVDLGLPDLGSAAGVPVAAVVAGGCLIGGILVDLVSRVLGRSGAAGLAARVDSTMRSALSEVGTRRVLGPLEEEVAVYASYRAGLLAAIA